MKFVYALQIRASFMVRWLKRKLLFGEDDSDVNAMAPVYRRCVVSWAAFLALCLWVAGGYAVAPGTTSATPGHFIVLPLGVSGGIREGSLTSFALASSSNTSAWVMMDGGTIMSGLLAIRTETYSQFIPNSERTQTGSTDQMLFLSRIQAYLVTHGHLDHCEGIAVISPDDGKKRIVGLNSTINSIVKNIFNWESWPNMGNEGINPLKTYTYMRVNPKVAYAIPGTPFTVEAFPLSHSGITSTAFFIKDTTSGNYVLFFGDTGPDAVEKVTLLRDVWTRAAPLVTSKKLQAIFIECSYANGRADNLLFGHLTPSWILSELSVLSSRLPETTTYRPTVVVIHVKPSTRAKEVAEAVVLSQLTAPKGPNTNKNMGYRFVVLSQGRAYDLNNGLFKNR